MSSCPKPKIFISYSHEDEEWMELFEKKLKARFRDDFDIWHDREIKLGEEWFDKVINSIHDTKIAVLLISDDFLTSNFIEKEEIPRFRQLAKEKQLKIVPVIIRSCAWKEYGWLSSIQGYPKDNKPLDSFQDIKHLTFDKCPNIGEEITNLTERIKREYEEEINNPKVSTDIELLLEKLQNYLFEIRISTDNLKQIAKKYLNDEVSQKNIDNQGTFLDILSFLDGHDKEPLPCIINEIYQSFDIYNQEIKEWLDINYKQIHCEQLEINLKEQNSEIEQSETLESRIIVDFEAIDKQNKYDVFIRYYINGRFTSSDSADFKSIDVNDVEFQKALASKIYDLEEVIECLDIFLPKQLLLLNIKQWKITNRKRLTRKYNINIHLRERAIVKNKQALIDKWNSNKTKFNESIKDALKAMKSEEDEATKDTKQAGLMYLYIPKSSEDFYDDVMFKLIAVRCGDDNEFEVYNNWYSDNVETLLLKDLKSTIDHDDNKHITLIWDDPNIPLKGDGING